MVSCLGIFLIAATLLPQLFLPVYAAKDKSSTKRGYHLYQESQIFGSHEIYASADGVKIINRKLGTSVVVRLPSMQFAMYNQRKKICYETKFATWKGGIAHRMKIIFPDQLDFNWVKSGSAQVSGMNATIFECRNVAQRRFNKLGKPKKPRLFKCFLADDIKVPEAAANMVSQYYDFPKMGKIPLRITHGEGPHSVRLDTVKSELIQIPASAFAVPSKLRAVKDDGELLLEGSGTGLLDLIGGDGDGKAPEK